MTEEERKEKVGGVGEGEGFERGREGEKGRGMKMEVKGKERGGEDGHEKRNSRYGEEEEAMKQKTHSSPLTRARERGEERREGVADAYSTSPGRSSVIRSIHEAKEWR